MWTKKWAVLGAILVLTAGRPSIVHADPIHDAARDGDVDRLKALLKDDPDLVRLVDTQFGDNCTPLHLAVEWGRKEAAEMLLDFGADINAPSRHGTPLHLAVRGDRGGVTGLLLSKGRKSRHLRRRRPGPNRRPEAFFERRRDLGEQPGWGRRDAAALGRRNGAESGGGTSFGQGGQAVRANGVG